MLTIGSILISYRSLYCSMGDSWSPTFGNLELSAIGGQQSFWRHWHCLSRSCCWQETLICSIWSPLSHSAVYLFLHATSAGDILMAMNSALVGTSSVPRPGPPRRFTSCRYAPLSYFAGKLVILLLLVLYDGAFVSILPPFFATRLVSTACSSFLHANSH